METIRMTIKTVHNIVLTIGRLNGFVSTEVQNLTSVLRLKFSAKIPPIANTRSVVGNIKKTLHKITLTKR
ncbi:hypothetical protein QW060_26320 [Myroides ceti]|uniref:Ribosomal protein L30 n=1 Tax=Paenimyroides ceti TaxID=395087 RepID=A0ABT8D1B7_9FLAO|nr:hypothetical protein [Paenimyroides ceti]MDN3706538.1 hypothetical protein [Paenimyroides ceti]MDN3710310.1 hypothetical protein [Paenimyroides ceti]MDN3710346.1 hypothetical protein [Paenimyroides ceti]